MTSDKTPPKARAKAKKASGGVFPIVGIGASAGGLEAFEHFFLHTDPDSGMAFVLVSHLDPGHVSMLTDILQRVTVMPVLEAQNDLKLAPDSVYVIPPNRDMIISHGALKLRMPEKPRGQRMPIDLFFRSLAREQGEKSVGIILSGTGTDGTLGLREIHSRGGVSFVQDPSTAKYDGMPASAISAGYVTRVLPVEKMPEALQDLIQMGAVQGSSAIMANDTACINKVLILLRSKTGHDFSQYKKSTINRRIKRRMIENTIDRTEAYLAYLKEFPEEIQSLFKELLINVTSFFRDPGVFDFLEKEVFPKLFADKPDDYTFRVWVPGCSTGEEAYSFAILFQEYMERTRKPFKIQIYATDIDAHAITKARGGLYLPNISEDVSVDRLQHFFVKEDNGYRVKKGIRDMVVFAVQDVIKDPPFTKRDILSCRNLMIYLEAELQNRLILAFHYSLRPGGVLVLSPSESLGTHSSLFTPKSRKWKVYEALHSVESTRGVMSSGLSWTLSPVRPTEKSGRKGKMTSFAEMTRRALLNSYSPASVLTSQRGDILYVHGDTGKYLRLAPGELTSNVIEMARENLQLELRDAIYTVSKLDLPLLNREVTFRSGNDFQAVNLSVSPLPDPETGQVLLLITFQDRVSPPPATHDTSKQVKGRLESRRIEELERDLSRTKESLQITIEEQQASNEELKSTNEELQSTNEELETSKEELQSINEELLTVNAELQEKIEQLDNMQNDMKNLLDNINVGTLFLDENLRIRRFSRETTKIYRLIDSDIGRPLGDIKSNFVNDNLTSEAKIVLDSLVPVEREVQTTDNTWFLARIQPYRTLDNMIQGVVLTFTDITKQLAAELLQKERELAEEIVNTVWEPLVVLNGDCMVVSASPSFYREFGGKPEETIGRSIYQIGNRQWDVPELKKLLETILPFNKTIEGYALDYDFPGDRRRTILLNARRLVSKRSGIHSILLAMELR
jgi:two-component system CheB/CheR fusion protein